ncbi:hypothetical protein NPIL_72271 [Nephila pilipes]|uniref:Uncharacterized protein n=1 Tax=Nephila pilipes TaxID=299642 RepID=A0A8X6NHZ0_NEPPI|nr:hypothetical protein NPIL_72271 [Nephila pilipes]
MLARTLTELWSFSGIHLTLEVVIVATADKHRNKGQAEETRIELKEEEKKRGGGSEALRYQDQDCTKLWSSSNRAHISPKTIHWSYRESCMDTFKKVKESVWHGN